MVSECTVARRMSVQAIAWVLDGHPSKGAQRLVMIALANHANDEGECWPKVATIAREANLNEQHTRRCLADLEAAGWITRVINGADSRRVRSNRRANLYRLLALDGGTSARTHGPRTRDVGTSECTDRVRAEVPPQGARGSTTPIGNRQVEPSVEPSAASSQLELVAEDLTPAAPDPFDIFWSTYPRRVGKDAARKAFAKAIDRAPVDAVLAGAERYAAQRANQDPSYTAHPSTWLNQGRWMDEAPATGPVMSKGAQSVARWLAATGGGS